MHSVFISTTLAALVMSNNVFASAIHQRTVPTVVPGPGLPTLESLGLTSSDLYNMTRITLPDGSLNPSQECGPGDEAQAGVADVTACFNYLTTIGSEPCGTGTLCTAGTAVVFTQAGSVSSQECSIIAVVIQEILNRCGNITVSGDGSTNDGGINGPSMVVRVLNAQFP